jgi:tetraprenyl-beta-curcumene synthase
MARVGARPIALTRHRPDPAPLTARQLRVVATGAGRELGWGLRTVRGEVAGWRARAAGIEDPDGRRRALAALADKRPLLDGAALFWTLPDRRHPELVRLLVAFQALANFHDHASERAGGGVGVGEPGSSMTALLDAVDRDRPVDAYRDGSSTGQGAYLEHLAGACRSVCGTLPNYGAARPLLLREVRRGRALDLEHDPDPARRSERLREFADTELGAYMEAPWWERSAGAASLLTAIVLLALAADEATMRDDLVRAADAYTWVASASAFLDNYVDRREDARTGAHNYLTYYATEDEAVDAVARLIGRSLREVAALRHGERHVLIVTSMVAMYLSSDGARGFALRDTTRRLVAGGGTLTRVLLPILRTWRLAYGQKDGC